MDSADNPILIELLQGYELTKELQGHLQPSCQVELCKSLTKSIMVSFEKAMSVAKSLREAFPPSKSPRWSSVDGSPKADKVLQEPRQNTQKRKAVPKWTKQIKVGTNGLGPALDGSCWRKYGQKDILGAKHPRSYFRCSYRHSKDCLAKKLVQRSDEDPTILDITYRGEHTCFAKQYSPNQSVKPDEGDTKDYSPIARSFDPSGSSPANSLQIETYNHIFSQSWPSSPDSFPLDNCVFTPSSKYHSLSPCPAMTTTDSSMVGPSFELERVESDSLFPFYDPKLL